MAFYISHSTHFPWNQLDPLIETVDNALVNLTEVMSVTIGEDACNRRLVVTDSTQGPGALARTITDAISSVNAEGIIFSADVIPYFSFDTFSVGVSINLNATIAQTAAEVIEIVTDFVAYSTDPWGNKDTSKLGLGDTNDAPVIDFNEFLSKVALAAGFDISFGIEFDLVEIQNGIFTSYPLGKALSRGTSLSIDSWGAFADISSKFHSFFQ